MHTIVRNKKLMRNIKVLAALAAAAATAQAAQIFEFNSPTPIVQNGLFRLYSATNDDVHQATSGGFSGDGPYYVTEDNSPALWARYFDGVAERAGYSSVSTGFESTEGFLFWGDHDADPADLVGSGVTYIRILITENVNEINPLWRDVNITGHDGQIPSPDGGATFGLLGLAAGALVLARRR
jgi:hypothetical protein